MRKVLIPLLPFYSTETNQGVFAFEAPASPGHFAATREVWRRDDAYIQLTYAPRDASGLKVLHMACSPEEQPPEAIALESVAEALALEGMTVIGHVDFLDELRRRAGTSPTKAVAQAQLVQRLSRFLAKLSIEA